MEGSCSTGQSPQCAVVAVEEEEEEEEEEDYHNTAIYGHQFYVRVFLHFKVSLIPMKKGRTQICMLG
jgi:hypothetical protein